MPHNYHYLFAVRAFMPTLLPSFKLAWGLQGQKKKISNLFSSQREVKVPIMWLLP